MVCVVSIISIYHSISLLCSLCKSGLSNSVITSLKNCSWSEDYIDNFFLIRVGKHFCLAKTLPNSATWSFSIYSLVLSHQSFKQLLLHYINHTDVGLFFFIWMLCSISRISDTSSPDCFSLPCLLWAQCSLPFFWEVSDQWLFHCKKSFHFLLRLATIAGRSFFVLVYLEHTEWNLFSISLYSDWNSVFPDCFARFNIVFAHHNLSHKNYCNFIFPCLLLFR